MEDQVAEAEALVAGVEASAVGLVVQAVAGMVAVAVGPATAGCLPVKAAGPLPDNVYNLWQNQPRGSPHNANRQP